MKYFQLKYMYFLIYGDWGVVQVAGELAINQDKVRDLSLD